MEHSFDMDVAVRYGIEEAIILKHIAFWVFKNTLSQTNFHDGRYWTYNSYQTLSELFPYMTKRKIRYAISNLEENGLIVSANYNQKNFDQTKWYSLTDFGEEVARNENTHVTKLSPPSDKNVTPIPYINNTDTLNNIDSVDNIHSLNNKNNNTLGHPEDDNFERLWKLYPKKKGKGQVSRTQKKKLYRIGFEVLSTCIERYSKEFTEGGKDMQYMMYGSTFFNSGYIDYLDENYLSPHANVETSTYTGDSAAGGWES